MSAEPAGRTAPLHGDEARPEFATKKLFVEVLISKIQSIIGPHRIGILVPHGSYPLFCAVRPEKSPLWSAFASGVLMLALA